MTRLLLKSLSWAAGWYPEIRAALLACLVLSLVAPPWTVEDSQGQTLFLGWHSLFTQSIGYPSLARLGLFWLLIVVLGACAQLLGELRLKADPSETGEPTFFAHRLAESEPLASPARKVGLLLVLPLWLLVCRLLFGRAALFGLEAHLGFFLGSVLQLAIMSRALVWISRERSHLRILYGVLTIACLAWDLRVSPTPSLRVGGLVPLTLLTGYLLYRFDLRFAVTTAAPAQAPLQETAPGDDQEPPCGSVEEEMSDGDPEPLAGAESETIPEPDRESESEENLPVEPEDPYQRYRPKA